MLLLTGTSDLVRVITDATSDIEVHASWVDHSAGVITPGRTNTPSITTATTTTVVGSPAASTQRNVKHLSLTNNHASTSCNVAVDLTDGANPVELRGVNLLAGENLTLDNNGNWRHYDANGGEYVAIGPAASQAEMEAGTSLVTFVSPGRQHFHPSSSKFWVIFTGNSTTITASYNMTSITDGTTTATVTIATDFSAATWCVQATAVGASSSVAAARLAFAYTLAAGAVSVSCTDAAATAALQDPTSWCVSGLGDHA